MTNRKLTYFSILFGSVLINIAFFTLFVHEWNAIRPFIIKMVKPLIYPITAQNINDLNKISEYITSHSSKSDRIDFIRNWVYQNSVHKIDAEHKKYAFKTKKVLPMLWNTHQTSKGHPHLSCGPRAAAMSAILDKLEIPNRMVMIFTDENPQVNTHTFLEVFNIKSNQWEIQDPDFNIYYVDDTQKRISTLALIFGNLETITPISMDKKGWKDNNVAHLKKYFEALMYYNKYTKSTIITNMTRFNAKKIFEKNGHLNFYQFAYKHYRNPIIIEN